MIQHFTPIPQRNETLCLRKTYTQIFLATPKYLKQPKCPSIDDWINKMWDILAIEYYSAVKRNKVMIYATTLITLENIILGERIWLQKSTHYMITCI